MSGRKASEVNSLLRNGEKTRCASIDILNSSCKNAKESTDKAKRKKEECETKISNIDFVISDDAKCEFPNLANELEEEVKKLKNEKSATIPRFDSLEYDNIMADYKKNDEFADVVRKNLKRKISSQGRNDPWYCDSEYADAKKVQDNYRKLSQRVSDLNRDSSKIETSSNAYISNLDMRLKRAEKLREEIEDLEDKTWAVKNMRKKASEAKSRVNDDFNEIEQQIADKFLKEEYCELKQIVDKFKKYDDDSAVKECTEIVSKISSFRNKLDEKYGEYIRRKEELTVKLNTLEKRVNKQVFSDPEDEFSEDDANMNSLIEFLKKFSKEDYPFEILERLEKSEKMIRDDKFDETEKELKSVEALIADASEYAANLHENKMKTIYNMLTIEKAMLELNYDVNVSENPNGEDGYCIECSAGDECITFDKVSVVDDGRVIITIDHKEATKGTCAASWDEIRKKLAENELFIEDITKNGKSIHDANREVQGHKNESTVKQNLSR